MVSLATLRLLSPDTVTTDRWKKRDGRTRQAGGRDNHGATILMLVDKIIRVSFVRHDPLFCPSPRSPPVATTQRLSLSLYIYISLPLSLYQPLSLASPCKSVASIFDVFPPRRAGTPPSSIFLKLSFRGCSVRDRARENSHTSAPRRRAF